ncbi:hypothetical protein KC19_9G104600 [Ceratodon purpureus]|uniref:Uncharacterized protein n=1 Tax=Ceratodon purpureus TaxID=3225 RepID=A0A8T0GUA6_CERPU|nr:hypothetical protein KC19_9G104600 [Ceratodon purpureus]
MAGGTQSLRASRSNWVRKTEDKFELVTIFKVPESVRVGSERDFEPQELHVGLLRKPRSHRNLLDEVKERLALLLHEKTDWEDFVRKVVPNLQEVQDRYDMDMPLTLAPSSSVSPPSSTGPFGSAESSPILIVKDLNGSPEESLTLDALFLVLYLHATNKNYVLKDSDLILLENQIPMVLLGAVIKVLKEKGITTTDVDEDLDMILNQAVRICYPFLQKPIDYPETFCQWLTNCFQERPLTSQGSQSTLAFPHGSSSLASPQGSSSLASPQGSSPLASLQGSSSLASPQGFNTPSPQGLSPPSSLRATSPPASSQGPSGASAQSSNESSDTLMDYLKKYYGEKDLMKCDHILECVYRVVCGHTPDRHNPNSSWIEDNSNLEDDPNEIRIELDSIDRVQPAVNMEQCSIRLRSKATSMKEIKFQNENATRDGICCNKRCYKSVFLNLPQVNMDNSTVARFRNLAIYEQRAGRGKDLRNYLQFMSELVNNAADAELLRKRGVIKSLLGSDDEIVQAWTNMCDRLTTAYPTKAWVGRVRAINKHCKVWYYRTRKECITTYCSTPGLSISIVVLFLIFLCTLLQTWANVIGTDHMKPVFKKD